VTGKLTPRQRTQLAVLETLQRRFEAINRLIEELGTPRADEAMAQRLYRVLDAGRAETNGVGLGALSETMGQMGLLARRGAGIPMRVQGLREGFRNLKAAYEASWEAATSPVKDPEPAPGTSSVSAPPDDPPPDPP
jgi:hypothetical protein